MKTQKQAHESKQIRSEANQIVDQVRKQNGLAPLRKELKPLVNFEADDAPSTPETSIERFHSLFESERSSIS